MEYEEPSTKSQVPKGAKAKKNIEIPMNMWNVLIFFLEYRDI